jgi:hypothetical protein
MRCIMQPVLMCCLRGVSPLAVSRRAWIEANRLIRKRALGPAFDSCWDSLLFLNLFVLLMSFFSCDWILLTFLMGRLAGWYVCIL